VLVLACRSDVVSAFHPCAAARTRDNAGVDEPSLADCFRAATDDARTGANPELEAALRCYVQSAKQRWPEFGIEELEFVRYAGRHARDGQLQPALHAADLLLACACSKGLDSGILAFQRELGPVIDRVLSHRKASADVAADARQIIQERLLVGDPSRGVVPKIDAYLGAGPLRSWVATTAATTLLSMRRAAGRRREQPEDSGGAALGERVDPELDHLKLRYKPEVEQALVEALEQLDARERTLLRLHLGERLSIDALGSMYSVNRATAARWVAAARRALVKNALEGLGKRLRLSETECNSLLALVRSQLDISLVRRLSEG
jgi:RNA polymerase sigma-70 factor (ECF subfamily)